MISNSLIYFFVRFGNGILAIATLACLTRLLSPSEYGMYAILVTIALTTSSIFFYWLTEAVGRFLPIHYHNPGEILAVVAKWFWKSTAVVFALFIAAFPLYEKYKLSPIMLVGMFFLIVVYGRYTIALQIANSQNSPISYGLLSLSKSAAALLFGVVLIKLGFGGQGALFGFLAGILLSILVFEPQPRIGFSGGKVNASISMDVISYGLPLTLSCLGIILVDLVDRLMIGSILGVSYVAPYAIVSDFVLMAMGPVMNILMLSTLPLIFKTYDDKKYDESNAHIEALGVKIISLGLPLVAGLCILSEDISKLVFGDDYQQATILIMPWLVIATFVGIFKSYYLDVTFQLRHKTKYLGYIALIMAVVNIIVNLLFLSRYGVIAAAWATLAAYLIGSLMSWIIGRRLFSLPCQTKIFLKCLTATIAMSLVLYLMVSLNGFFWLIAKILIALVVYAALGSALNIVECQRFIRHYLLGSRDR